MLLLRVSPQLGSLTEQGWKEWGKKRDMSLGLAPSHSVAVVKVLTAAVGAVLAHMVGGCFINSFSCSKCCTPVTNFRLS